jgi:hypothetical protein
MEILIDVKKLQKNTEFRQICVRFKLKKSFKETNVLLIRTNEFGTLSAHFFPFIETSDPYSHPHAACAKKEREYL